MTATEIAEIIKLQRERADVWTPDDVAWLRAAILASHAEPAPLFRAHAMHACARQIIEAAELTFTRAARYVVIAWRLDAMRMEAQPCESLNAALARAKTLFRIDRSRRMLERRGLRTN